MSNKKEEMKNTLGDLNAYLFDSLNALSNDELEGEKLEEEIRRSKAVGDIAKTIIGNAAIVLQAQKLQAEYGGKVKEQCFTDEDKLQAFWKCACEVARVIK